MRHIIFVAILVALVPVSVHAAGSPCQASIDRLQKTYVADPAFGALVDEAFKNVKPRPATFGGGNPWEGKGSTIC